MARTLLEGGRKAISARKYDDALSVLRKALVEDPHLVEAAYWIAVAHEKGGDDSAALPAYREFLSLLEKKSAGPSPEEKKLQPLAEKRVEALSVGEKEFEKIEDKYISDLLDFARDRFVRDPGVAVRALDLVLAIRPKYPAAVALKEKIAGKGGEQAAAGAFADVAQWRDLIADRTIIPVPGRYTYTGETLTADMRDPHLTWPRNVIDMGSNFAYEIEFRVLEAYEAGWSVGLAFANSKEGYYKAMVEQAVLTLRAGKHGANGSDVKAAPLQNLDPAAWHRLGVVVRGNSVQVWFEGRKVIEERIPSRPELTGEMGVGLVGCRTEWRVFRAGRL